MASENGHVDIVKELYQACANINACDKVCQYLTLEHFLLQMYVGYMFNCLATNVVIQIMQVL